jgi:DNA helicase-2/ATP-dependent DNA helicase PcrA
LFNRIVEDALDVDEMKKAGLEWQMLVEFYEQYRKSLENSHRVDFAHIQKHFVEFLDSRESKRFTEGDPADNYPGLLHVLVDEYQDTNPIQEVIYLKLARRKPHNVAVVGDDDQALYRFRGGTVECMIQFDEAIKNSYGTTVKVSLSPLVENYRSHPKIVEWCNAFMKSFGVMSKPGARAPGKPQLIAKNMIAGDYPPVSFLSADKYEHLGQVFGKFVKTLKEQGTINDYSECVFLLKSTRRSPWNAGPFMDALDNEHIKAYNPRSKSYLEAEEIKAAMGAFLEIIDHSNKVPERIKQVCDEWRATFHRISRKYPDLQKYVDDYGRALGIAGKKMRLTSTMQDVLYHILNHDPFLS